MKSLPEFCVIMLRVAESDLSKYWLIWFPKSRKCQSEPGTTAAHPALDLTAMGINSVPESFISKLNPGLSVCYATELNS